MTDKTDMRVSLARIDEWKNELRLLRVQGTLVLAVLDNISDRRTLLKQFIEAEKKYHAND